MLKIALFPGSFDPITIGHQDIITRALPLIDKLIIAIGNNSQKQYYFDFSQRSSFISAAFMNEHKIEVMQYDGLTIDFCSKVGAQYIVRGLRSASDFDYEKTVAQLNQSMNNKIETLFFISKPQYSHISSTIVREIIVNGGDYSQFIPKGLKLF